MRKFIRGGEGLVVACVVLAAGGCADRGYVQREWSTTMRELGVVPVFPPREDVFVGDVYAYQDDPESLESNKLLEKKYWELSGPDKAKRMRLGMSPRLLRLDLTKEASDEYSKTPSWPATTGEYEQLLGAPETPAINAAMADAQKKLDDAKAKVTALETDLSTQTENKRLADVDVTLATDTRSAALTSLTNLRKQLEDARTARRAAQAGLETATKDEDKAKYTAALAIAERSVATLEKDVSDAEAAYADSEKRLSAAKKRSDDAAAAIQKATSDKTDAGNAVTTAKAAQTALDDAIKKITQAGGKSLYSQPKDGTYDVYDNDRLPVVTPKAGATNKEKSDATAADLRNSRVDRLRLVAFPDFSVTTFTEGEINALVPIEAFALGARTNFSNLKAISVKVPAAESYSVPLAKVQGALFWTEPPTPAQARDVLAREIPRVFRHHRLHVMGKGCKPVDMPEEQQDCLARAVAKAINDQIHDGNALPAFNDANVKAAVEGAMTIANITATDDASLCNMRAMVTRAINGVFGGSRPRAAYDEISSAAAFEFKQSGLPGEGIVGQDSNYYFVRIITEVFYARALDVSIVSKSSFGVRAELEAIARADTASGAAPTPVSLQNPQPGAGISKDPVTVTGADMVARTQAQLGERLKVPGGSVQLVSYNDSTIGLRRLFDRPVAIGFRGITLTIDKSSMQIVRTGSIGGTAPTLTLK